MEVSRALGDHLSNRARQDRDCGGFGVLGHRGTEAAVESIRVENARRERTKRIEGRTIQGRPGCGDNDGGSGEWAAMSALAIKECCWFADAKNAGALGG